MGFPQRRKDAKALSDTLSLLISLRLCAFAGTCFFLAKLEIDPLHLSPNERLASACVLESSRQRELEGDY
jgi:hypothetical protein